jgi:hypothetical protein
MTLKSYFFLLITSSLISLQCGTSQTATKALSAKESSVKKLLESRQYRFVPQSVQAQGGRSRQITNYSLEVRGDTLISYLPYYGVAYSAPVGITEGPLDFKATNITYTSEEGSNGNNLINIKPGDARTDAQEFFLSVSSTGYTNLSVRFNNRQSISFYGEVRPLRARR